LVAPRVCIKSYVREIVESLLVATPTAKTDREEKIRDVLEEEVN
jgi:hypothetical protein